MCAICAIRERYENPASGLEVSTVSRAAQYAPVKTEDVHSQRGDAREEDDLVQGENGRDAVKHQRENAADECDQHDGRQREPARAELLRYTAVCTAHSKRKSADAILWTIRPVSGTESVSSRLAMRRMFRIRFMKDLTF